MNLYEELIKNGKSDIYPFHMPGHKRRKMDFPNPYDIDITEIDGFDNLHHATGVNVREFGACGGRPCDTYQGNTRYRREA